MHISKNDGLLVLGFESLTHKFPSIAFEAPTIGWRALLMLADEPQRVHDPAE